jgi:hypothetical protein
MGLEIFKLKLPSAIRFMDTSGDGFEPVAFKILHAGCEVVVTAREDQYFSLMSLIVDKIPVQNFGICSGMGSCGTCAVSVYDCNGKFRKTTLSCQIRLDHDLDDSRIVLRNTSNEFETQ